RSKPQRFAARIKLTRTAQTLELRRRLAQAGTDLERFARFLESSIGKRPWLCLAALCLAFLCGARIEARGQPFWLDEIITEYISAQPSWREFWAAHGTTAD